uniref:acyloxyacyl hydrolase n=1 Tax=Euleptes europaea TaxID=460621 RepID=UPI00253F797E|nr:acyloxyacyl hydrolase [Euleptes europaea]
MVKRFSNDRKPESHCPESSRFTNENHITKTFVAIQKLTNVVVTALKGLPFARRGQRNSCPYPQLSALAPASGRGKCRVENGVPWIHDVVSSPGTKRGHGITGCCYGGTNYLRKETGCVIMVSVIEQLSQIHNSTVTEALEMLCSYLPEQLKLQKICFFVARIFGPDIIKLLENKIKADVACYSIKLCKREAGQPVCHVYHPSKVGLEVAIKEAEEMATTRILEKVGGLSGICSLPLLQELCRTMERVIKNKLPFEDFDGDKFSTFPTLRGYHWRGRDCNDETASVYPGRRPDDWDAQQDSNCNGIWGIDGKDGIPYEQKFCNGTESKGVVLLGDSAGAHFHIPPKWLTTSQISWKAFFALPKTLANEFDWPQFSEATGFLNSTIGGWTDSIYVRLRQRNRCNHRDYQNISKNGASSKNLWDLVESLARSQQFDKPAIVTYALIGNDVCNGKADTVSGMTTPEQMYFNIMKSLRYLNSLLPKGSHVILVGLVDGTFLWDTVHDRYHPLGQLNKDITYKQIYSFLSCLKVNPCNGWLSSNATLRNVSTERAMQLSSILRGIAESEKYANFDLFYMDYPLKEIVEKWRKMGGENWQLIEPVDGFHPSQFASALLARIFWEKILRERPHILGKANPLNDQIAAIFKDQGGY